MNPEPIEPTEPTTDGPTDAVPGDRRLYVAHDEGWTARVKPGWERERCYAQRPGEDFFHLIMHNELHLVRDHERYCLDCALRLGLLTTDRLQWQHVPPTKGELP
jgi:hypothetical protein